VEKIMSSANTSDAAQKKRFHLASDVDMGDVSGDTRSTANIIEAE